MLLQCDVTPLISGAGYAVESMNELIRRVIAIGKGVCVSDPIQGGENRSFSRWIRISQSKNCNAPNILNSVNSIL